jgi:hypothetical protein
LQFEFYSGPINIDIFSGVFMNFILSIAFLFTNISWGKFETDLESQKPSHKDKIQQAGLVENCISGIIKSRPELANQAKAICSRLAKKKSDSDKTAGRTMEDCLRFMRQFSVPASAHSLCEQIIADLNPKKTQRRVENKKPESADSGDGIF